MKYPVLLLYWEEARWQIYTRDTNKARAYRAYREICGQYERVKFVTVITLAAESY